MGDPNERVENTQAWFQNGASGMIVLLVIFLNMMMSHIYRVATLYEPI